jgi:hypothetical protein
MGGKANLGRASDAISWACEVWPICGVLVPTATQGYIRGAGWGACGCVHLPVSGWEGGMKPLGTVADDSG